MIKWLRPSLILIAAGLFIWQGVSYFTIDYDAIEKSVRKPMERQFIEFDEGTFDLLKELDEGKRINKLRERDFGRKEIFLPD